MLRLNKPVLLSAVAVLTAACVFLPRAQRAFAQQAAQPSKPPQNEQSDAIFTADTNLVLLPVSVLDKTGKLVTNLPQSAFKVYENGVEQPIKLFRHEDVPVSMGIIIDNSGSMRDKRAKVAAASLALVKASNPDDEVFIVNFNDVAYLDQPFTSDIKKLEEVLDRIDSRGGTAMWDAINLSIDYEKDHAKREKKVLLVVTDGNNNASEITLDQLAHKAQQSDVLIYAIGLLSDEDPHDAREARKALKLLTGNSGGLEFYPKDVAEIDKITPQIAHEIRSQYMLGYLPLNPAMDGTFRKITVVLNGYKATVRTRNGYYATATGAKTGSK